MIIKSQRIKKALLTALADEEMLKIVNCVIDHSKSFNDIIAENSSISRTTAFRKIKWLLKEGLVIVYLDSHLWQLYISNFWSHAMCDKGIRIKIIAAVREYT